MPTNNQAWIANLLQQSSPQDMGFMMLQQPNMANTQTVNVPGPSELSSMPDSSAAILAAMLQDEKSGLKSDLDKMTRERSGPGGALATMLGNLAAAKRRTSGEEKISGLYDDYFTAQNAQSAQAREQATAAATLAHNRKMEAEQAKQESIAANRAPVTAPATPEWIQKQQYIAAGATPEEQEARFAAINPGAALQQEKYEAKTVADTAAKEKQDRLATDEASRALETTRRLLANKAGMAQAAGTVDAFLPTFREAPANFERDLESLGSLLTLGNLDRMTGVLSESDIKLLRDAATGNLDLSQGEGRLYDTIARAEAALAASLEQDSQYQGTSYQAPGVMERIDSLNPFTGGGDDVNDLLEKYK